MQTRIKPGIDARTVYKIKPRSCGSTAMGLHTTVTGAIGNGTRASSLVDVSKAFSANLGIMEQ